MKHRFFPFVLTCQGRPKSFAGASRGSCRSTRKNRRGFTLIEILIALVLFFIIVVVAVLLLKSSGRLWLKTTAKLAAFEDCLAVAGVIRQDIWSATVVSVEAGGNGLSLINADGEQIQYELVEKKVRRKKDKSSSFLTYDETITGLNFYDFLGTGVSFEVQTGGSSVFIFWVRCRGGG